MVVLIVESAPPGLRGELSKWMLEPKAGVFVGTLSATVRDLLWEKACQEVGTGGCTMIYRTNNEQGFAIRSWGETTREIEEWEGLFLVRRPNPANESKQRRLRPPGDWNEYLHPEIWAKTARGVTLAPGEENYHPLSCHMIDTAMVAYRLWQYVLPHPLRGQICRQLKVSTDDEAGRWLAFFAGLHDIGKATPTFAKQWPEGWKILVKQKYGGASGSEFRAHYVLSTFLLESLLEEEIGLPPEVAIPVAAVVGAHHGLFPTARDLRNAERYAGTGRWAEAQAHLVQLLAHVTGVDKLTPPAGDLWRANSLLVILAGLTSVADWIASNHDFFPYVGNRAHLPHYARRARWLAWIALYQLGWFHRPKTMEVRQFQELFDKRPNGLQKQVISIASQLEGPSLVILEYPMGGGKTEAALYLADYLASTSGQKGAYFALPTMATSNQMFGRVAKYLADRFPGVRINAQLLHGQASLNEEFAELRRIGQELQHRHRRRVMHLSSVGESHKATVLAAEWFTFKKRGLLAPYGIGTIDQALLGVLQTKHFFVRLFGLAGKVVILDEVHAYDTYMQVLLARLLTWLAACGTSVIILSATLPAHTRQSLLKAYSAGRGVAELPGSSSPYPRITWLTDKGGGVLHVDGVSQRSVELHHYSQAGEEWICELKSKLKDGGCAAVIVNTVSRAQMMYRQLQQHFPADELFLFHARYPLDERLQRENEVLSLFGPASANRPTRAVLVATQVIEQSLDLDFDLMVTDLAPIDLVLQRSGRLWRHHRKCRPSSLSGPTLWLLMPELDEQGVPIFDRGTLNIYDPHTLLRSWLVLANKDRLRIPDDVEDGVESVYRQSDPPGDQPKALQAFWLKSRDQLLEEMEKDRQQAARRYIPDVSQDLLELTMEDLEEEGEGHPALQALTRLGGISVTVVCLIQEGNRMWVPGPSRREIRLEKKPDVDDVRALIGRSVNISFDPELVKRILDLEPPETWETSAYLRRCRLLCFDNNGKCVTAELPLLLDPQLGLMKLKEGE